MANQSFLNSMTFASGCSCDECGIPEEILEAVRKRQRLNEEESIKFLHANIQQKRELVARHGGYSIWRLVLPADGEGDPIVEMRNSWRVVFVEMLSDSLQIQSIGRGIIGSAAEELERKLMPWEQGRAYFLPVDKGVPCGWVCKRKQQTNSAGNDTDTNDDENTKTQLGSGTFDGEYSEVALYILKVTADGLAEDLHSNAPSWAVTMKKLFPSLIDSISSNESNEKASNVLEMEGILLTNEDSHVIGDLIDKVKMAERGK